MNTEMVKQFDTIDVEMLSIVEGGRNNWQTNVREVSGAAVAGWGVGTAICATTGVGAGFAPICGAAGAKFGVALWAGVTAKTGGF